MAKLKSQTFPLTNQITMSGGRLRLTGSSVVSSDRNDQFLTGYNPTLWTLNATNYTEVQDPYRVELDGSSSMARFIMLSSYDVNSGSHFAVDVNQKIETANGSSEGDSELYFYLTDGPNSFRVIVSSSPAASTSLAVQIYSGGGLVSSESFAHASTDMKLRVIFTPDNKVYVYRRSSSGLELLGSYDFTIGNGMEFQFGAACGITEPCQMVYTPEHFIVLPVVSGIYCKTDHGLPTVEQYDGDDVLLSVEPHAPGPYTLTVYGSGSYMGQTEEVDLEVLNVKKFEDSTKFLISPVEGFDSDAETILACRRFGIPSNENKTSAVLNNKCVCDGSSQDASGVDVLFKRTGVVSRDGDGATPGFVFKDGETVYGNNMEPMRLYFPDSNLSSQKDIRLLRCLPLSDGDRFYYGVVTNEPSSKDVVFSFTRRNASYDALWVIRRHDELTTTVVDSGLYPSGPANPYTLEEGFYSYELTNADGSVAFRIGAVDYVLEASSHDHDNTYTIFFEVKQMKGALFYIYYDRCNNTVQRYVDTTEDVSLRTDSLAAIEKDDGDIVVFFEEMVDDNYYNNQAKYLSYRLIDRDTRAASPTYYLRFPMKVFEDGGRYADKRMHSFDVLKVGDKLEIFFNMSNRSSYAKYKRDHDGQEFEKGVYHGPFLESGVKVLSASLASLDLAAASEKIVDFDFYTGKMKSIERLFKYSDADFTESFFDSAGSIHYTTYVIRAEAGFIRAAYDEKSGKVLLSVLDNRKRAPLILYGRDGSWREVAIPFFFKVLDYHQNNYGLEFEPYFNIRSIGACYTMDGLVKTVANRYLKDPSPSDNNDEQIQVMYLDPDILVSSQDAFLEYTDKPAEFRFYKAPYRQEKYPLRAIYSNRFPVHSVDIVRHLNYEVLTIGMTSEGALKFPHIYQMGCQDEVPFSVSNGEVWTPDHTSNTHYTLTGTYSYYNDSELIIEADTETDFIRNIDTTVPAPARDALENGYKVHARVDIRPVALYEGADFPNPLEFRATFKASSSLYAQCAMKINSTNVKCLVNDPETGWVEVHQFNINAQKILDYYILVKKTKAQKYEVSFVVKDIVHKGEVASFDFRTSAFYHKTDAHLHTSALTPQIGLHMVNGVASPGNFYVYEFGWGLLSNAETAIDGTGFSTMKRENDSKLLSHVAGEPDFVYDVSAGKGGVSESYHWPNGFEFSFSGGAVYKSDSFTVQRQKISNLAYLNSRRVHGSWRSKNDLTDVYIWADAKGSGLDKFDVEAFVVKGCNVPEVVLVGRDSDQDPWTEVATLNLKMYSFNNLTYSSTDDGQVVLTASSFDEGEFEWTDHFFNSATGRASKVVDSEAGSIVVENKGASHSDSTGYIFANRGAKVLESEVSYRYVGIKIPAYNTYHGYFRLECFDFGRISEVPIEYHHDLGSGASVKGECESYFVYDEQPFYMAKKRIEKGYNFNYSIFDGDSLLKVVSVLDGLSVNRRPIWVIESYRSYPEKVSLCLVDEVGNYTPLVDEDGDKYYEFSFSLRSVDGD